jgi:AcrR family transcriptional regulator
MPQRSNAQQNRARILKIARETLTSDGDASLNSIAKKAGVGPGTLYRHFPNRESLLLAVYRTEVQRLVKQAPQLLKREPPLIALRQWFEHLAAYLTIKHGLGDAIIAANDDTSMNGTYRPVIDAIALMLRAGEQDGTIRPDLNPEDVLLIMSCVWHVPLSLDGQRQAKRMIDILINGFSTNASSGPSTARQPRQAPHPLPPGYPPTTPSPRRG